MFYKELINCLMTDPEIAATVTTFDNLPSIFQQEAPEKVPKPYIVVMIDTAPTQDKVVSSINVFIDYFDYDKSRVQAGKAALAIEDRLDSNKLRTENLTDIRFSMTSEGYIPESDPRTIHHNSTFSCRAARSGWMKRNK